MLGGEIISVERSEAWRVENILSRVTWDADPCFNRRRRRRCCCSREYASSERAPSNGDDSLCQLARNVSAAYVSVRNTTSRVTVRVWCCNRNKLVAEKNDQLDQWSLRLRCKLPDTACVAVAVDETQLIRSVNSKTMSILTQTINSPKPTRLLIMCIVLTTASGQSMPHG